MSNSNITNFWKREPYIPQSLSEIWDQLGGMILEAPLFVDKTGFFPDRNIDSEFHVLVESFGVVRKKLGEERYAQLLALAAEAKALFAADPEDVTGDTRKGYKVMIQIEDVIQDARRRRFASKLVDDEGEVTGD